MPRKHHFTQRAARLRRVSSLDCQIASHCSFNTLTAIPRLSVKHQTVLPFALRRTATSEYPNFRFSRIELDRIFFRRCLHTLSPHTWHTLDCHIIEKKINRKWKNFSYLHTVYSSFYKINTRRDFFTLFYIQKIFLCFLRELKGVFVFVLA